MVQVRKLVLAIAAASALTSGTAHALGLGEVTLKSSLSQPLVAEIELLEVRDLGTTEVIPALASPEEFSKAGVDRQYFLTDLKFTPVINANGKSVIRVTSTKPVREPYLNFLVEVLWPNGRLLREYTLLLDPPMYSPQAVIATAPSLPVAAPVPRPQATAPTPRPVTPSVPAAPPAATAPRTPSTPAAAPTPRDEYKTTSRDTLWDIAQRTRQGGSVHQAMLAIQALNPNAFVDGNINRLKSGQVLRLPDEQQIRSRSQAEAIAQVAEQNNAWREGRSLAAGAGVRQLDATTRTAAGEAPAKSETKDSLKLVSPASEKAAGDNKALGDQLAVTKESLDSTRRENQELSSRMTDLQSQVEKLQKLIELKDNQLAKLQSDLAAQGKQAAAAVPATSQVPVEAQPAAPAAEAPPAAQPEPAVAPTEAQPAAEVAQPVVPADAKPETEAPDFNYSEEPATEAAPAADATPAAEAPPATEPAADKPAEAAPVKPAKPVEEAPAVEEPQSASFIDELLGNPMLLGIVGGGALLVLLIALMALSRRNAMKEAELHDSLADVEQDSPVFETDLELPDDGFAGLDDTLADTNQERIAPQTSDALGEADIYIAYGKFSQAAELLQNAINDEPQRSDLRLKLMEVYAELGDRDGFERQEQELREIGGAAAGVEQLKAKYPAMVALGAAGGIAALDDLDSFSLDDLTLDEPDLPAPVESKLDDLDDAFDLSLDDLDAELNAEAPAAVAESDPLADLGLDADFSLPDSLEPAGTDGDLDFALGLESDNGAAALELGDDLADFSLDLETDAKPAAALEDEFLLSLDDEPAASTAQPSTDFDLSADFDLSLDDEPVAAAPATDSFAAQLDEVNAELEQLGSGLDDDRLIDEPAAIPAGQPASVADLDMDDDFDFLSGTDETATKLDLARAYIDMGDTEGARDILDEVVSEGSEGQQQEARELIAKLV